MQSQEAIAIQSALTPGKPVNSEKNSNTVVQNRPSKMTISTPAPIKFVALISRDDRPLYIQSFNIDDESVQNTNDYLKYNFLSHIALDILSSPVSMSLREQQQEQQQVNKTESSAILLFIQDQVMVYGYETNNGLRIVVGLDQSYVVSDQGQLRQLFLDIHKCYLRTILNPFNHKLINEIDSDATIQSPTFDRNIKRIVDSWPPKPN